MTCQNLHSYKLLYKLLTPCGITRKLLKDIRLIILQSYDVVHSSEKQIMVVLEKCVELGYSKKTSEIELENNVRGLSNMSSCQIHHLLHLH